MANDSVPRPTFEERGKPKLNRTEVLLLSYHPNALPVGQAGSRNVHLAEVLLYVHRNRRLIRDGSPGWPPRLSHSA